MLLIYSFIHFKHKESDGTDSKGTGSSKTTIEMYQSSNSTAYHKSNNETSLSEEDDNKSQDAYSGHTDYEMVNVFSIQMNY